MTLNSSHNIDFISDDFAENGLFFEKYLEVFRRRYKFIFIFTFFVTLATFFVYQRKPDKYLGSFTMLVSAVLEEEATSDPSNLSGSGNVEDSSNPFQIDYSTLIEILQSRGILSEVVTRLSDTYPELPVKYIQNNVTVERVANSREETRILEVEFSGTDSAQVKDIIESLSEVYLNFSLEERRRSINEGIEFINQQLPNINERIGVLRDGIIEIQSQYLVADPNSELNAISTAVRSTSEDLSLARRNLRETDSLIAGIESQLNQSADEALVTSSLNDSSQYQQLLSQLLEIESRIEIESVRFSDSSPIIRELEQQRDAINGLLRNIEGVDSTLQGQFQGAAGESLRRQLFDAVNERNIIQTRISALEFSLGDLQNQAQELPNVIRNYEQVQSDLRILEDRKSSLLRLRETLRIESNQSREPWRLVSPPSIPTDEDGEALPIPTRLVNYLLLGTILGIFTSALLSISWEIYQDVFYSVKDIKWATQLPTLGVIPYFKNRNSSTSIQLGNLVDRHLLDTDFSAIYAKLGMLSSLSSPLGYRSIFVTSAMPEDGKSMFAYNLANIAVMDGKKVLLVQDKINLISSKEDAENNHGSDLQSSDKSLVLKRQDGSIVPQPIEYQNSTGFWILRFNYSMLFKNLTSLEKIDDLQNNIFEKFDLIIYDSCNISDMPNRLLLAKATDISILIVRLQHTKRSYVSSLLPELLQYGISRIGLVVNKCF
ncbi:MAG: hypothetical protein AAGA75_20645 [Cyanobacteria bacterium P01_E01_bin.6]